MENASKALLIAGASAILIVILLIGIGMLIYSRSTGVVDLAAGTMTAQEIQAFNSQFTPYEGKQKSASVKNMISVVIANNATYANDENRKVSVSYNDDYGIGGDHQVASSDTAKISSISLYLSKKETSQLDLTVTFEYNDKGLINIINITRK